jgi:hypothetical protein
LAGLICASMDTESGKSFGRRAVVAQLNKIRAAFQTGLGS